MLEITDYMERYLVDQFATLEGVAIVRMNGARRYAMRVWLSRENLAARQLTVADVENSLLRENVELPAGRLESREREFTLRTDTNLRTEEDFRNLVVGRGPDGYLVRLGEVAEVRLASDDDRSLSRSNGEIGLSMAVIPQSKANVLATSGAVKKRLAEIQSTLPKDMTVEVNIDNGVFIAASLKNVVFALTETLILVLIVIFLFLGTLARHADSRRSRSRCPSSPRRSSWRRSTIRSIRSRCSARCSPSASWSTMPSSCSRTSCGASRAASRRCSHPSTARTRSVSR